MAMAQVSEKAQKMKVTKCVTIHTFKLERSPKPPPPLKKWVTCFRVTPPTLQPLCTTSEWEKDDTSHVLLDINAPKQQLYHHLPMLITPVDCIYLITFDLRYPKESLNRIHNVMKNVYTLSSYRIKAGSTLPVVLLVGMHADKAGVADKTEVTGKTKEADKAKDAEKTKDRCSFAQELTEQLTKMPYNRLINRPGDDMPFWAIDGEDLSLSGTDPLSCQIQRRCSRHGFEVRQWIKYHHKLQEDLKDPCILYHDLRNTVTGNLADAESKFDDFLEFLHNYGFIFYHSMKEGQDADKVVLVQPQYLSELFDEVLKLSKTRQLTTIADLLSSTNACIEASASHEQWFQRICIDLGLVVQCRSEFIFVMGLKAGAPDSPPLADYSVPPLLMTFKDSDHFSVEPEYLLPSFFFAVFVTGFLKALTQHGYSPVARGMEQHYVPIKIGTVWIHLVERDYCIEIGLQQLDFQSREPISNDTKIEDLHNLCVNMKKVVVSSADSILGRLKLSASSIRYGFYHSCGAEDTPSCFGALIVPQKQQAYLECPNCDIQPTTPLQGIWFLEKNALEKVSMLLPTLPPTPPKLKGRTLRKLCDLSCEGLQPQRTPTPPPIAVTAKQVLEAILDRFIEDVDAGAIAFDLRHKNIIDQGVSAAIRQTTSPKLQNQLLYEHLEKAGTKDALMEVCGVMIAEEGYPKMKQLGKEMKSLLEGHLEVPHEHTH